MLNVRSELCIGCGKCEGVCPTGAISLRGGKARINQSICANCYRCAQACPKGAIGEVVPHSSAYQLKMDLLGLKNRLQMLNQRLNQLEKSGH